MFNKIWKEQIVRPTSKVGIFKPKQGFDLEEDEDDNCNKQLQEYANKIKNTPLKMKEAWNTTFKDWQPYFVKGRDKTETDFSAFEIFQEPLKDWEAGQYKRHLYNPIPEKIACYVLEMLKDYTIPEWGGAETGRQDGEDGKEYTIEIDGSMEPDSTFLSLIVQEPNTVINFVLSRWESIDSLALSVGGRHWGVNAKKDLMKVIDLPESVINSAKCDFLYEWLELLIERLIKLPFTTKYNEERLKVLENIKEEWDRCEKNV